MNNRRAKALRKIVYRDNKDGKHDTKYLRDPDTGTLYVAEERRTYQDAKRTIKQYKIKSRKGTTK